MQFTCPQCKGACCTCGGCHEAVSLKGTKCCSGCVVGVNRTEAAADAQLQRIEHIQQKNRPNERLYINGQ